MNVPTLTTGTAPQLAAHSTHLSQLQTDVTNLRAAGVTDVKAAAQAVGIHALAEAGLAVSYIAAHRVAQYCLACLIIGLILGILIGSHL
jgi:hypothetical protein